MNTEAIPLFDAPPHGVPDDRFAGIARLYGTAAMEIISTLHIGVIGLGGVGSWAVEALARSGVGAITLIDADTVSIGNINRQLPALSSTVGRKKLAVLAERVADIHPGCRIQAIDDYLTMANLRTLLAPDCRYDYVIDAIDSISFKAAMTYSCKRSKIPIIVCGAAGGITDPTQIRVKDLSRTTNDALLAKVRAQLRSDYGYTSNPQRFFGIECVFSPQQPVYPKAGGSVGPEKPGIHGVHLDCRFGYGSASFVTASFGFVAVARVLEKILRKRLPR